VNQDIEVTRELNLLEAIEHDPDTTQADLATRLGVAVGTVNWHIKRLVAKGYVKVKRAERRKLRYIITPEGLALRARLTLAYVEQSMSLYRQTREQARRMLKRVREAGYDQVRIDGDGDIADVCRLTCLELGMDESVGGTNGPIPAMRIEGRALQLEMPAGGSPAAGKGEVADG